MRTGVDWGAVRAYALAAAAIIAIGVFLVRALDLLPPERVVLAAGREGGAYHAVAQRYRALLAGDGIEVEIVETAGSGENAELIGGGEVDAAILQGGVDPVGEAEVEALGGLFLEPLLLFTRRGDETAADPSRWAEAELEIAAGEPGSGTRAVVDSAERRLSLGLDPERLQPIGGAEAAEALLSGAVDAAIFVAPIDAPYLAPLIEEPEVAVAPIRYVDAIAKRLPFVRVVEIPAAGFDFAGRLPPEPIRLPAMIARLAARADMHPALVNRLVNAARDLHSRPDLLSDEGEFPTIEGVVMEIDAQARTLIEDGPSALEAAMPYWLAAQINRVLIVLVPLIVVALPLLRALPGLYQWRMKARIWRRYDELAELESEAETAVTGALPEIERRLDRIEEEARTVSVPSSLRWHAYALRLHIDHVRRAVAARREGLA